FFLELRAQSRALFSAVSRLLRSFRLLRCFLLSFFIFCHSFQLPLTVSEWLPVREVFNLLIADQRIPLLVERGVALFADADFSVSAHFVTDPDWPASRTD